MEENTQNSSLIAYAGQVWRRRKWLMLGTFITILAVGVSLVMALPSMYRSSTTILFGQDMISESLVRSGSEGGLEQRLQIIEQSIMSRTRLQELVERMDLYPELRQTAPAEVVINQMRRDIGITREAGSQQSQQGSRATVLLIITYQGWDAEKVAAVANELARLYQVEYEGMRLGQASSTTEFLRAELDEVEARLTAQETRINDFKNQHLGQLPQQQSINLATLERLNAELRLNSENQFQLLNQSTTGGVAIGLSGEMRLNALRQELAAMRVYYSDVYPGVIRLQNEISALEESLADADSTNSTDAVSESDRLRRQESDLRARIAELQERIELTPTIEQELTQLTNDYNRTLEEYTPLQRRYQEARLAESLEMQQTRQYQVLETALPPAFPFAPNSLTLMLLALMAAGGASAAAVFVREQMDSSFHTVQDLRRFTRLPVLGSISAFQTTAERYRNGMVSLILVAGFASGVVLLVLLAHQFGTNAEQLVVMLAGGAA